MAGCGHAARNRERGDQLVGSGHPVVIGRVERGSAIIDFNELRVRLGQLATYRATYLTGDEKGESQVFLDRLFQAFGHQGYAEAGAKLEMRIKSASTGGTSFADLVWKPRVLIEMKKAGSDLSRHYRQAFDYWVRAVPDRPRYVVLCNFDEFWVYDFDYQLDEPVSRVTLAELSDRWEPFGFMLPEERTSEFTDDLVAVTRDSAVQLARLFNALIGRDLDRDVAQRFVLQAVMAMFSEDIRLLPTRMFTAAVADARAGGSSYDLLFGLFEAMNTSGVTAGGRYQGTPYFNGGLYATVTPFELEPEELAELAEACRTDWSLVRPEIFGTLFEQSLGRDERHAYGAHFTSPADIAKIVGPSMTEPWRHRITAARTLFELRQLHIEMSQLRVLDPACGCGNFLYVAYRELRRLERDLLERIEDRSRAGGGGLIELPLVSPEQFHGIDIRPFAVEIAKVTLMVAKKLATDELGDSQQILPLENLSGNFTADDALRVPWPTAQLDHRQPSLPRPAKADRRTRRRLRRLAVPRVLPRQRGRRLRRLLVPSYPRPTPPGRTGRARRDQQHQAGRHPESQPRLRRRPRRHPRRSRLLPAVGRRRCRPRVHCELGQGRRPWTTCALGRRRWHPTGTT